MPEAVGASLEEGLARDQLLRDDAGAGEHGEAAWLRLGLGSGLGSG